MTINRAFIKAYRHDEAQASPVRPVLAPGGANQVAAASTAARVEAAAVGERSALYGPPLASTTPPNAASTRHPAAGAPKQPLSQFIASQPARRDGEPEAPAEFLRPGTTIASFQWPPVCRSLAQQCGGQLDPLAELLAREAAAGRSLIGVVGLSAGAGASTIALSLAARLARRQRLILVDGNFRRPELAGLLEAAPTIGWQDVLKRGGPLADAVVRAVDDRLDLLALEAGKIANAERLVGGLQAVVTAGVLRHAYDVVLIDAGSLVDAQSQPIVLELVRNMGIDAAVGVTGPQPPDARRLDTLAAQLARSGCELLGTVQNRAPCPQAA